MLENSNFFNQITAFSVNLKAEQRETLYYEYDFFDKILTIGQIIRAFEIKKDSLTLIIFKQNILLNKEKIMYIPQYLANYYKTYCAKYYYEHQKFFNYIIDIASNKSVTNILLNYYKKIFGENYKNIISKIKYTKPCKFNNMKILPLDNIESTINLLIKELDVDKSLNNIWGKNTEVLNLLKIDTSNIYLKYFNLTSIANFESKTSKEILQNSIYFNIYPGLCYLNNNLDNYKYPVDYGAHFLFVGWSAFSLWHYKKNESNKRLKEFYFSICNIMLNKNLQTAYQNLYIYLSLSMSQIEAIEVVEILNTYPSYIESFALGSKACELLIKTGFALSPNDFIKTISKENVGNYFSYYFNKKKID